MNFEKIKEFILEKKQYFIIGIVVVGILFWIKGENSAPVDNSNLLSEKTEQSKNFSSTSNVSSSNTPSPTQSSTQSKTITCDITGAIKHQGVYTLKNGARLQELIDAAGGAKQNAQLKAVNRAILLKDQDKIHIPYKGEKVDSVAANPSASSASSTSSEGGESNSGDKVNLNTASAQDLQKLNGIGQKKAEQIIAYRDQNGQFKKIEDLTQVSGIGEKTFAALKDQLTI
ncbi:helix-hairpin-helix domain-containing protein [Lactobacillus sp. PSON]|uniref:helix-hairpin-helix domain-containing protein n=1 Tax=Lactobacillus sp. PSON TaxID=3455454 RepID=UPI0040410DF6